MTNPTTAQMAGELLDGLVQRYCAELERLNYGRATISVYRRSIERLRELMVEHDIALDVNSRPNATPFSHPNAALTQF